MSALTAKGLPVINPAETAKIAYTGTPGTSAAMSAGVYRLVATSACCVAIGANPTATTSDMYLPADCPEYFRLERDEKVSAIQISTGGSIYVTRAA